MSISPKDMSKEARAAVNRGVMAMAKTVTPQGVGLITIAVFPNADGTFGVDFLTTLAPDMAAGVLSYVADQACVEEMVNVDDRRSN